MGFRPAALSFKLISLILSFGMFRIRAKSVVFAVLPIISLRFVLSPGKGQDTFVTKQDIDSVSVAVAATGNFGYLEATGSELGDLK